MTVASCLLDIGQVVVGIDFHSFGDRMRALTGSDAEQLRMAVAESGLAREYETGRIDDSEFYGEVCRRLDVRIPRDEFERAWNSIFIPAPLLPEELIRRLAAKLPLWAVSNTNKAHFSYLREHYPLLRHFTGLILSHEVGMAKPDPGIFRLALSRAAVAAADALFVDDQAANVEAARGLGIDAFQFLNPGQFVKELQMRHIL